MIRVDYAGPGGSCEGIRSLGLESVGFEFDAAACRTRAAAGSAVHREHADHSRRRPRCGRGPSGSRRRHRGADLGVGHADPRSSRAGAAGR